MCDREVVYEQFESGNTSSESMKLELEKPSSFREKRHCGLHKTGIYQLFTTNLLTDVQNFLLL